jgi:hypothetical protein
MRMVPQLIVAKATKKLTYNKMLLHCWTGNSTVMYKQDVQHKIYGQAIKNCEDYALFLEVLKHIQHTAGFPECLVKYRIRKRSLSRNKFKKLSSFFELMINIERRNVFFTVFYLFTNQLIKVFWKYRKV